jgi:ubiquitin-protein ligase
MQAGCGERLIIQEFKACTQRLRKGILVQPSVSNIFQWQVTLMPHSGVFTHQILTCWILFENFPASIPRIRFQEGIIHPLIDPNTNRFNPSEMFSDWNFSNRVYTLLNFVYDSFIDISVPAVGGMPDPDAAALIRQSTEAFQQRALRSMPVPPDPAERNEFNVPKRWGKQKERVAHILAGVASQQ